MKAAEAARLFAIATHGSQRYGQHPYAFHLNHVVGFLEAFGEGAQVIGYLHDVVEDTAVEIEDISGKFGRFVADCVAILTDESGNNRKERKAKTYAKMAGVSGPLELALIVKVADRLANVETCIADKNERLLKMYRAHLKSFDSCVIIIEDVKARENELLKQSD